jgi:HK97 family phage major capsid protein
MSEDVFREIFQAVPEQSIFMSLAKRLPDMAKRAEKLSILDVLPYVYFTGEKGQASGSQSLFSALKKTTRMAWKNKYIVPGEIAAIIPIPENTIDDEDYPIWDEIKPQVVSAIGQLVDLATLFGTAGVDIPAGWPSGIVIGAPGHHLIPLGSIGDLYSDLLEVGGVWNVVELDGYEVNGAAAVVGMKAAMRACRDTSDHPILVGDPSSRLGYTIDGVPFTFSRNGGWDPSQALLIAGDWNQAVFAVRKDVTYKVLDQAVITDDNYNIIHNLAQEDMVALRITFRMGWQLPNPTNQLEGDPALRYPFGILTPAVGSGTP